MRTKVDWTSDEKTGKLIEVGTRVSLISRKRIVSEDLFGDVFVEEIRREKIENLWTGDEKIIERLVKTRKGIGVK